MNVALRRMIDAQYGLFRRTLHPSARAVAAAPGRVGSFDEIGDGGYCLLVTFKRDGTAVPTTILFALADDGNAYMRTEPTAWKVRRIRNNPHVRVARSNPRGKPTGPVYEGRAQVLPPEEEQRAHDILWDSYSLAMKLYEGSVDRMPVPVVYLRVEPVQ
jgi:PPOX class probable F420-dependent enzyme